MAPGTAFGKAKSVLSDEKLVSQGPKRISIIEADARVIRRPALANKDFQTTTINMVKNIDGEVENFTREMESLCKRANGDYSGMGRI